jgi:hypothetical protein
LRLHREVPPVLRDDLARLFGALARTAREHDVPVTVLFIPTYEQIARRAPFAFQDELAALCRGLDLDVCDPRGALLAYPDVPALFLPDRHFTPAGNRVLLDELLGHLRTRGALAGGAP